MNKGTMETDFLPAERASDEELSRAVGILEKGVPVAALNAVPVSIVILNAERQIVFCNGAFQASAHMQGRRDVIGRRPGEALGCLHAREHEGGCGTTKFCRYCGAAVAILESLRGEQAMEECRVVRAGAAGDESLDLQVFAKPLEVGGETFSFVTALDISHEKRREALERIFFHDVLNSASGLVMYSGLMEEGKVSDLAEAGGIVHQASARLLETVQAQKDLAAAEAGRLAVCSRDTDTMSILLAVRDEIAQRQEARTRELVLSSDAEPIEIVADPGLVRRVLGALALNALEAVAAGGTATLSCRPRRGGVEFSVHNEGVMADRVRRQLFKRSFSTKGKGRGLGLYMARLVGEGYLGGSLQFVSDQARGTMFTLRLMSPGGD